MHKLIPAIVFTATVGLGSCALTPATDANGHHGHEQSARGATAPPQALADQRLLVKFPDQMRDHTLANMRDHLATLSGIQEALATGHFDRASELAENRLGMSSLTLHGAHDVARFMPEGMQAAGTAMHHSASRFALAASEASATGDLRPALAELANVSQTCVACHAGYRLQ